MAESTLTLTHVDAYREVGRFLGYNRDSSLWTANETADVNDCIEEGLRRFYFPSNPANGRPHKWSFLYPYYSFSTSAPYNTGTVTIVNGVVTLDSGTFPSWAAEGEILINGVSYDVDTRDSDTQVTLIDLVLNVAAGSAYKLGRHVYDLPDDFGSLDGPITYRSGEARWYPGIEIRNESDIRRWRQTYEYFYFPLGAAIVPKTLDATTGQRWNLLLGPTPDREFRLQCRYQRLPNTITSTDLYHWGGAAFSQAVLDSCLAAAELKLNDTLGPREQRFQQSLTSAIAIDKSQHAPDRLGYMGDPNESVDHYYQDAAAWADYTRKNEGVEL